MGGSRYHSDFILNRPKIGRKRVLIFWSSIPCVFCLYIIQCTLLKVVSYYDLSVLSMSVMGFKKVCKGRGGWGELYQ